MIELESVDTVTEREIQFNKTKEDRNTFISHIHDRLL